MIADNIVHFARVLRDAGMAIGPDRVLAALSAVEVVGLDRREDVHAALSAVMLERHEQQTLFDAAFDAFFRDPKLLEQMMYLLLPKITGRGELQRAPRANRLAESTFGYSAGELIGRPVESLIPARYRHAHPRYRNGFLDETAARPMGAGRDLSGLRKDGSEFPVEVGINPVETGEGPMVLSVILDLSERKQSEKRIQDALTHVINAGEWILGPVDRLVSDAEHQRLEVVVTIGSLAEDFEMETQPQLLLADEPTGNLDTQRSVEIMELIARLNRERGITVIMVTHEPDMAAYARRVVRFVDGVVESDRLNPQRAPAAAGLTVQENV